MSRIHLGLRSVIEVSFLKFKFSRGYFKFVELIFISIYGSLTFQMMPNLDCACDQLTLCDTGLRHFMALLFLFASSYSLVTLALSNLSKLPSFLSTSLEVLSGFSSLLLVVSVLFVAKTEVHFHALAREYLESFS